jgi:hypothetical protein
MRGTVWSVAALSFACSNAELTQCQQDLRASQERERSSQERVRASQHSDE